MESRPKKLLDQVRDALQRQCLAFRSCDDPSFMTVSAGWGPRR